MREDTTGEGVSRAFARALRGRCEACVTSSVSWSNSASTRPSTPPSSVPPPAERRAPDRAEVRPMRW